MRRLGRKNKLAPAALGALVLAGLGAVLGLAPGAQATYPGSNGKIAFVKTDPTNPANRDIYTINADGTGTPTNLIVSRRDGNPEIYLMNADGSNPTRLTNNPALDVLPSWSPNGNQILFSSTRDGNFDIYLMNADGSKVRRLTDNPAMDLTPEFSPDGHKIVFASNRSGAFAIWVMSANGGPAQQLTDDALDAAQPDWSPDGKQIAFIDNTTIPENSDIFVMDAGGRNVKQLTESFDNNTDPSWSPDGQKLTFDHGVIGSPADLYTMGTDGSNRVDITNTPTVSELDPDWGSG